MIKQVIRHPMNVIIARMKSMGLVNFPPPLSPLPLGPWRLKVGRRGSILRDVVGMDEGCERVC